MGVLLNQPDNGFVGGFYRFGNRVSIALPRRRILHRTNVLEKGRVPFLFVLEGAHPVLRAGPKTGFWARHPFCSREVRCTDTKDGGPAILLRCGGLVM